MTTPTPDTRTARETWSRCLGFLREVRVGFVIAAWASALTALFTQGNALVLKVLFDDVLLPAKLEPLMMVTAFLIGIYAGKGATSFIARHTTFLLGSHFAYQVRQALYAHLLQLPMTYFEGQRTGQILNRFTVDVQAVQNNTNVFYHAVKDFCNVIAGIALLLYLDWRLAVRTFFVIPLVAIIATHIARKLRTLGRQSAQQTGDVTAFLQESVVGVHEIQGFSVEARMNREFDGINAENKRLQDKAAKYQALSTPIVEMIVSGGLGWVIWSGANEVIAGRLTPGGLLAYITALGLLFEPMRKLADVNNVLNVTKGHADRILDILDEPITITEPETPRLPEAREGRVEIEGLSFSYEGQGAAPTLDGIDLEARPGEVVALVGSSGAGKSTLVKLLPRFYDCSAGEVRIDGVPNREWPLAELRRRFAIVPQDAVLFSGSVRDNIAFGREDASDDEVRQAAADANALAFIEGLDQGFDTQVGERGTRLSGGQKQRIAIARALVTDPEILILDEATSALDTESERLVQEALDRLMQSRTTFVIAHRLSTIQKADQILVMSRGKIVERGPHAELLSRGGEYARLCRQQVQPMGDAQMAAEAAQILEGAA